MRDVANEPLSESEQRRVEQELLSEQKSLYARKAMEDEYARQAMGETLSGFPTITDEEAAHIRFMANVNDQIADTMSASSRIGSSTVNAPRLPLKLGRAERRACGKHGHRWKRFGQQQACAWCGELGLG